MKITRRQLRRIIKEAIGDGPQIGDRYSLVRQTGRTGSYSPYREAEVVGFGRSPLGKTVIVKSISDQAASEFGIPLPAFKKQFRRIIKESLNSRFMAALPKTDHGGGDYSVTIMMTPAGNSFFIDGRETYLEDVPSQIQSNSGIEMNDVDADNLQFALEGLDGTPGYEELDVEYTDGSWAW